MSKGPEDPKKADKTPQPKTATALPTPKLRRGLKGFIADVSREMKKVSWPTKKETNRLTMVVLSLVVTVAVMLSLMGWASHVIVALITKGRVN
jgi:preprotein translocase SecE subunit